MEQLEHYIQGIVHVDWPVSYTHLTSRLIQTLKDITFSKASDSDMKRENANIDADTAMGTMLKYGSESAKQ